MVTAYGPVPRTCGNKPGEPAHSVQQTVMDGSVIGNTDSYAPQDMMQWWSTADPDFTATVRITDLEDVDAVAARPTDHYTFDSNGETLRAILVCVACVHRACFPP